LESRRGVSGNGFYERHSEAEKQYHQHKPDHKGHEAGFHCKASEDKRESGKFPALFSIYV